ncbi:LOW QUALITY PROTEIN: golgin subfamily A member 4 [Hyperolius riggenbachi]|uniref:LOW QUALITY PROTEIN: golgin subfamily A member 4 n=1 Tax=Hyperolius riggenbachi TaxID=752182 RepID=UPI0035A35678
MFKKLKQKISEEQSPVRSLVSPQQQGHPRSTPVGNRSRSSSVTDQQDESTATPDKELLAGMIAEPALLSEYTIFALDYTKRSRPQSDSVNISRSPDSMNGNDSASGLKSEAQSFAQKLQLRVPSMESLFRSPVKETLFRASSKESLVRSSSRESLNRMESDNAGPTFDPASDIESEAEDPVSSFEGLSKEQLLHRLNRMEKSLGNYRGKYSELVTTYRIVQRDKEKLQSILSQSQDKALRRIGELREELQMDQQAKKHLQEEFDASLEEKDQLISVLQTQVTLLKQRLGKGQADPEATAVQSDAENVNRAQEGEADSSAPFDGSGDDAKTLDELQVRVKRQENLLQRCKEMIRSHKEKSVQLTSEKEALQNQLDERLQELERIKELHTSEKTKLITQLRDAKNLVEQLEQDKGMMIAETKRQMHETLMTKEEEVSQLRTRVKQLTTRCSQLQEEKEKSEKTAFEQLEKAVAASQSSEEAQKIGKQQMEEQINAIEKASEEERVNLQRELSRVKQEVVDIMKKTCDERILELKISHDETMQKKEQEYTESLRILEEGFQEKLNASLAKSQDGHLITLQEKEQQALLAVEEMELQKKAIQTQTENQLQEMQQELEECRTRILELESFLAKTSQDSDIKSEEMATRIECETNKHNEEITALMETHKKELELRAEEYEILLKHKLESLKQEHDSSITELKETFKQECDLQLKEKEHRFQVHIEEMNEKTLEKLDVKQTELEALSAELSEALKLRQEIEQQLLVCQSQMDKMKQDYEAKLEEMQKQHQMHIGTVEKEKEILTQGVEKDLKEDINHLKLLLDGKEKELEDIKIEKQQLTGHLEKANAEIKVVFAQINELQSSHEKKIQEELEAHDNQLAELNEKLGVIMKENTHLKNLVDEKGSKSNILTAELQTCKEQIHNLSLQIQEQSVNLNDQLNSVTLQSETKINDYKCKVEELNKIVLEKEDEILKLKETYNQVILELNEKVSSKDQKMLSMQEEYQAKSKSQDVKTEKMKQRIKEIQEAAKKKYSELESKMKSELEKKDIELSNKEKQFNEKILEMAQASSSGINESMAQLEQNHNDQIQGINETNQRIMEETIRGWEKKLSQHAEELKEKHEVELQEKEQEVAEIKLQLINVTKHKEAADNHVSELKEEKNRLNASINELQEKLNQASAQVLLLTDSENNLKSRYETLQNEYTTVLNDKIALEEQLNSLKTTVEEGNNKVNDLVGKLQETQMKLESLEACHNKESSDQLKNMADRISEKETECNNRLFEQEKKFESHCKETVSLIESLITAVISKYNEEMNRLLSRIATCEKGALKLKGIISNHMGKTLNLETKLQKINEECSSLNLSLTQATQHLQEKDNVIFSMRDNINSLTVEKEVLQKEGGNQQKVADENESCITQLKKELSENINTVTTLNIALKEKDSEINELKLKLENSVDLGEKEKAITYLNAQHKESQQQLHSQVQDLTSRMEALRKEKALCADEVDVLRNKLEEWKKRAEVKFIQNHQTIKELKEKIDIGNKQILEKEEQLQKIREDLKNNQESNGQDLLEREKRELEFISQIDQHKNKVQEMMAEIAKLTSEKASLIEDLDQKIQQQTVEKRELALQLEHIQTVASQNDSHTTEAQQQVIQLQHDILNLKDDLQKKQVELELLTAELTENKEKTLKTLEEKLTAENAKKIAELKKKAEQKIASVKKQLTSQLEEKEKAKRDLEIQFNELREQFKEDQGIQVGLQQENEEQENKYLLLVEHHKLIESELSSVREDQTLKEQRIKELEYILEDVQKKLLETEQRLKESNLSDVNDLEAEKFKIEHLSSKHQEVLLSIQEQLAAKDSELKACIEKMEEKSRLCEELKVLNNEFMSQENTFKIKLKDAEGEIQKFRKEVTKLQKDMRALRKEHNHELDLLKKEILEEAEEKIKHETEDSELKHNSTIKQLLREFNTKMAEKERELETAVQETIGKAQEVEAELMQSQRIETTQLHKKIAEKEDDLKRTVKKYEELLEMREEEMTLKVTELQEKLEQLQEELSRQQTEEAAQDEEDLQSEDLQTQLAKKTTQLNEAKLSMQELKEQINVLEDQLKKYTRGIFVSPFGTPYKDENHRHGDINVFGEPTEFEYLRKVMFEYMMGRETKTMAKVITTVLKFPADQAQKILEREDARPGSWLRSST